MEALFASLTGILRDLVPTLGEGMMQSSPSLDLMADGVILTTTIQSRTFARVKKVRL